MKGKLRRPGAALGKESRAGRFRVGWRREPGAGSPSALPAWQVATGQQIYCT